METNRGIDMCKWIAFLLFLVCGVAFANDLQVVNTVQSRSPVILTGADTGETDPIWGAVSNTVTTGAAAGATAMQDLADDTSPELGGQLDAGEYGIQIGASNILMSAGVYNGSNSLFFVVGSSTVTNVIPFAE